MTIKNTETSSVSTLTEDVLIVCTAQRIGAELLSAVPLHVAGLGLVRAKGNEHKVGVGHQTGAAARLGDALVARGAGARRARGDAAKVKLNCLPLNGAHARQAADADAVVEVVQVVGGHLGGQWIHPRSDAAADGRHGAGGRHRQIGGAVVEALHVAVRRRVVLQTARGS